jgi:hypothetical protein
MWRWSGIFRGRHWLKLGGIAKSSIYYTGDHAGDILGDEVCDADGKAKIIGLYKALAMRLYLIYALRPQNAFEPNKFADMQ